MVADDEALVERFVDRHGEAAAQFGEADQQQTQAVIGVHRVVGQQPQVVEYVVAQELRLVDDQDGQQFGLLNEAGDLGADGAVGGGAGALGGQALVISPSRLNRRCTVDGGRRRVSGSRPESWAFWITCRTDHMECSALMVTSNSATSGDSRRDWPRSARGLG